MSEIDWDDVANEAADSPRGLLAEVLGRADEIEELIIIANFKDGMQQRWLRLNSAAMGISMLALAQYNMLEEVQEESER